jgi:hypothetical protein
VRFIGSKDKRIARAKCHRFSATDRKLYRTARDNNVGAHASEATLALLHMRGRNFHLIELAGSAPLE